jgi:hypothetical protein
MSRKFLKVVVLVEGFGRVINAVEDYGDEGEGLAGVEAVAEGLGEEETPEPLALRLEPERLWRTPGQP